MKTPDEISVLVAEKVAGWKRNTEDKAGLYPWIVERDGRSVLLCASLGPVYATSADAVLPLLKEHAESGHCEWEAIRGEWTVSLIFYPDCTSATGRATTLPLAACLALLRSKGVEVETL